MGSPNKFRNSEVLHHPENLDYASVVARFLENEHSGPKDALVNVLGKLREAELQPRSSKNTKIPKIRESSMLSQLQGHVNFICLPRMSAFSTN